MAAKYITLGNLTQYNGKIAEKYATKAEIPTKVSDLSNDSNFQTGTQVSTAIGTATENLAEKATTLAGYNIGDAYTKDQTDAAINAQIDSVYKPAGNKTVAELTSDLLVAGNLGKVYNITNAGQTTADFVDGAGNKIQKGADVSIVNVGDDETPEYKFNVLAGFVDLTAYAKSEDYTTVIRSEDIEAVTEAEINALFAEPQGE